ncbi:MAG: c-type cytochrome domain-containing protein [Planctomycetota bacterium]|nr:c-type cytochrome domain-containing protein [Planctomycetota bacterium]
MTRLLSIALLLVIASTVSAADKKKPTPGKKVKVTYEDHVRPILMARCFSCHGPNKKEGDLDLTTYGTLRVGGGSGEVVEPGAAADSYLWSLVSHESEPFMPPKSPKLPAKELATIKAWIDGGVLENAGSKFVRKKPKFNLTLEGPSTGRPKNPAFPGRLGLRPEMVTKTTTAVTALATSPWAPLCAVSGQKQVLLYDTRSLELVGVLSYPEGIAHTLGFSRNGSLLYAGGGRGAANGKVVVWDVKSGRRVMEVGEELDTVLGADISSDHTMIALGSSGKALRVFSTKTGELMWEVPKKHTNWIYCTSFSPDGVLVASSDRNGGLFVWEAETGRIYQDLRGHGGAVTGLSWRSDSNILASCGQDGTVRLWEMENGRQVKSWGAHGGGTFMVEFCHDGNLVSIGRDKVAKLFKQDGGQIRAFPALPDLGLEVSYCDETKRVIAGDYSGVVRVYNAADGKVIGELSANPATLDQRLATANQLVVTTKSENDKQQAALKVAQAAANKVKADLDAANKTITTLQAKEKTLAASMKTYQGQIKTFTAEQAAAAKTVAALAPVVPLLKETADKAKVTAAKAAGDKELATLATNLKAVFDKRNGVLVAAKKTNDAKTKALAKSKADLGTAQKDDKTAKAGLVATKKRVEALTKAMKPAGEKLVAAQKVAAVASGNFAAANKSVVRWKDEIEFVKVLDVHGAKENDFNTAADGLAQAEGELGLLQKALEQKNTAAAGADKVYKAAVVEVTKATKGVADAQKAHATATSSVAALTKAIPLLKDAFDKATAAAKATGDKELAAIATGLNGVHGKKVKALEEGKKLVVTRKAEVDKAQAVLVAMQKAATAAQVALTAAQKRVADQVATIKPAQAKVVAAKKANDAAKAQLDAVQKQVDVFKAKTAQAPGKAKPATTKAG